MNSQSDDNFAAAAITATAELVYDNTTEYPDTMCFESSCYVFCACEAVVIWWHVMCDSVGSILDTSVRAHLLTEIKATVRQETILPIPLC